MAEQGETSDSDSIAAALETLPGLDRLLFGALLRRRWRLAEEEVAFDVQLHGAVRVAYEALAGLWRALGVGLIFAAVAVALIGHFAHVHPLVPVGIAGVGLGFVCALFSGFRAWTAHQAHRAAR